MESDLVIGSRGAAASAFARRRRDIDAALDIGHPATLSQLSGYPSVRRQAEDQLASLIWVGSSREKIADNRKQHSEVIAASSQEQKGSTSAFNRCTTYISKMTYRSPQVAELMAQRESLDKQLADAREKEQRRVLFEIVHKMREYGISLHELLGRKPEAPCVAPGAGKNTEATLIKYRDPVSGATWSGRGRVPRWIADKDRDQFLVERAEASARIHTTQVSLFSDEH